MGMVDKGRGNINTSLIYIFTKRNCLKLMMCEKLTTCVMSGGNSLKSVRCSCFKNLKDGFETLIEKFIVAHRWTKCPTYREIM